MLFYFCWFLFFLKFCVDFVFIHIWEFYFFSFLLLKNYIFAPLLFFRMIICNSLQIIGLFKVYYIGLKFISPAINSNSRFSASLFYFINIPKRVALATIIPFLLNYAEIGRQIFLW